MRELGYESINGSRDTEARRNRRKKETLDILKSSMGNVSAACEKVGISRATFYLWRQEDSEFDEAVNEINERTLDFVESCLMQGIKNGNAKLIMFYLVNRGRNRGYSTRPEDTKESSQVKIVLSSEETDF